MIALANWANSAAVLGIAAMLIGGDEPPPEADTDSGVDTMITGSIGDDMTVVDHFAGTSCRFFLRRSKEPDVRHVDPAGCEDMPAGLSAAHLWRDTPRGTATIIDREGRVLMELGPSDGFAFETIEPANVALSFDAS